MAIHSEILLALESRAPDFLMKIGADAYAVDKASITYSEVPVTKPTTRGGVYFADKMAFKIKAHVSDESLSAVLSKTMLGPNADFEKIVFLTRIDSQDLRIYAHLTNYVQKSFGLELNLVVVATDLSD